MNRTLWALVLKKYHDSMIIFCPIGKNENPNNKNIPKVVTTENDDLIHI